MAKSQNFKSLKAEDTQLQICTLEFGEKSAPNCDRIYPVSSKN
jgi:hypothetical protein